MKKLFLAALIMGAAAATAMDDSGWATQFESMSAFDSQYGNRSGYVKPIIDNLGNVLNSNWYASASVPQSFTFEAGLPISIIPIGDDDKSYDGKPTIFGDHGNPEAPSDTIYGIKTLNGLGVFTYPYLQMGASFYHFRAVLRMMYLPSISDLRKFSLFGIGFQYSFGHFFQYMLPKAAQPFDVSIVYAYNSSTIGYRPDEFDGKLGLDVSTHNFSFVFGYKPVNFFEVMMSLGYQVPKCCLMANSTRSTLTPTSERTKSTPTLPSRATTDSVSALQSPCKSTRSTRFSATITPASPASRQTCSTSSRNSARTRLPTKLPRIRVMSAAGT